MFIPDVGLGGYKRGLFVSVTEQDDFPEGVFVSVTGQMTH